MFNAPGNPNDEIPKYPKRPNALPNSRREKQPKCLPAVAIRTPGGMFPNLTAVIEPEGSGFNALCPELDIASQGEDVQSAKDNLREAVELFLERADPSEIQARLHMLFGQA